MRNKLGKRRREVGDDRPALLVLADDQPSAGPVTSASILVKLAVELARHRCVALSFAFAACPPYEALTIEGEVLASRRQLARFIAFTDLGLSPVALHIGPFDLRWYSLAYLAGIFIGYWYLLKLIKQPGAPLARRHADDLVFYAALGIILGGRLGYVLFYNLGEYLQHPIEILKLWDGGMSFHGGVIGTSLGILYFALQGEIVVAADPRLCRLLRAVRPVLRPARQLRQPGAVGRADAPCPGRCASSK